MTYSPYDVPESGTDASIRMTALAVGTIQRIARSVCQHLRNRRDYRHLQELPDYMLDDIGLTRADVRSAARRLPF
ncbi:DUF1127 domain-containing protein [Hoeflea sp.]|uniref:DUF1127 domain-containing protein n=1 Tax=Hoeflea sp. TaxID=1940281 RepID=UPI003A8FEF54